MQRWIASAAVMMLALVAVAARVSNEHKRPSAVSVAGLPDASAGALASWARDLDSLGAGLRRVRDALQHDSADVARARYRAVRTDYKRAEFLIEYYSVGTAAVMNGRRREFDDEDLALSTSLEPVAIDRVESAVVGGEHAGPPTIAAIDTLLQSVAMLRASVPSMRPTLAQLLDAARLEVARVETLSITGFDTPATHAAMPETADALRGVRAALDIACAPLQGADPAVAAALRGVDDAADAAIDYLEAHPDFATFDRLEFIAQRAEPLAHSLGALRAASHVAPLVSARAWSMATSSVLDEGAIDPRRYASADAPRPTRELEQLGQMLFTDPRLSGTGTRACTTCHRPDRAFSDGLARSAPLRPGQPSGRNTPTLLNAGFQPRQFLDNRAVSLEDQVAVVLASPSEMGSSAAAAATRISASDEYRRRFAEVFGTTGTEAAVTDRRLQLAIAAYVRSLTANHSRVDRALAGNRFALTPSEQRGFNLFMGKAGCGTCHFLPLFNGTAPPAYANTDPEIIGVPALARSVTVDGDKGAGAISGRLLELHAFKVPTLRNVALTAPYMHNGVFRTLDEVVAFYDQGGAVGRGAKLPNQTLPAAALHLSSDERADLVAMMRALTDVSLEAR